MALTGDGSMSTNCCTELRVWHTHIQAGRYTPAETHIPEQQHKRTRKDGDGVNVGRERKWRDKC